MNRKLLALAVGTALSLPVAGMAAPTVYGQLDLSLDGARTSNPQNGLAIGSPVSPPTLPPTLPPTAPAESWQVNSNASRLGVMGEEALGDGLSAIYKIEYGVTGDVAGAAGTDLAGRDRYVGLKGNFGTVRLGAFNSPLKAMQGQVDQFLDMRYADMSLGLAGVQGYNRMNNAIAYTSPKVNDAITFNVLLQPGETDRDSGLAEAVSTSVDYNANGTYIGLGYDRKTSNGNFSVPAGRDIWRLAVSQTMGDFKLGALAQTSEQSKAAQDFQQDVLLVSGAYTMGKKVVKAQIAYVKNGDLGFKKEHREVVALGYDYNFSKMTKVYAQADYGRIGHFGGVANGIKNYVTTIGMQTKF